MKIAVIVPVFNESERSVSVIKGILEIFEDISIIVIDDGSLDNSLEILKNNFRTNKRVYIVNHVINLGKGAAMKTGIKLAWKFGFEAVIFIDADGQHNPKYLPKFIEALNDYPIVFGYRLLKNNAPSIRKNGNRLVGWIMANFFNLRRKDNLCGFWGFKKNIYPKIKWKSSRYGVETEVSTKVGKSKIPFYEIKIDTIYIDKYKGVTIFDAFKILFRIPFWYFEK